MTIVVDLSAPEVNRQIALIEQYPEIAERHYKPVLKRDTAMLKQMIAAGLGPSKTGRTAKTLGSKVVGKGYRIRGEVGWYRKGSPFYVRFLEGGAQAHEITPRGSKQTLVRQLAKTSGSNVLRFTKGGSTIFVRGSTKHPGVRGRGFMAAAWAKAQSQVTADIAQANEAVVRELSIG